MRSQPEKILQMIELKNNLSTDQATTSKNHFSFKIDGSGQIRLIDDSGMQVVGNKIIRNGDSFYETFKDCPRLMGEIRLAEERRSSSCMQRIGSKYYLINYFSDHGADGPNNDIYVIGNNLNHYSLNAPFKIALENIESGIIVADKHGRIEWVNNGFTKMSGFTIDEVIGKKPGEVLQGKNTSSEHSNAFRKKLKSGKPFSQEILNYTKAGKKYWCYVHITPLLDENGAVDKYIGVETDITDLIKNQEKLARSQQALKETIKTQQEVASRLKDAEAKLKASLEEETVYRKQLQEAQSQLVNTEKMASLGQLTAGIAHEINNPINFVYNGIDALKLTLGELFELALRVKEYSNTQDADQLIRDVNEIVENTNIDDLVADSEGLIGDIKNGATRTMEIVKGLRVFSRLDEEEFKLADINENLDSTIILLKNKVKNRIALVKKYDPQLPPVNCYPGQLNQVFMNLINNAIQAIPDDRTDGEIVISTSGTPDGISISIADNGTGIPESLQKRIFEPFFTTKPVGIGTGLGLSISYGIIEKHKGTISVKSSAGHGTEFTINLPYTL